MPGYAWVCLGMAAWIEACLAKVDYRAKTNCQTISLLRRPRSGPSPPKGERPPENPLVLINEAWRFDSKPGTHH